MLSGSAIDSVTPNSIGLLNTTLSALTTLTVPLGSRGFQTALAHQKVFQSIMLEAELRLRPSAQGLLLRTTSVCIARFEQ